LLFYFGLVQTLGEASCARTREPQTNTSFAL
jgi:hypothetical protein